MSASSELVANSPEYNAAAPPSVSLKISPLRPTLKLSDKASWGYKAIPENPASPSRSVEVALTPKKKLSVRLTPPVKSICV